MSVLLLTLELFAIDTAAADSAELVGSGQCSECHAEVDTAWRESDHRKAMLLPSETSVLGNFKGPQSRPFSKQC